MRFATALILLIFAILATSAASGGAIRSEMLPAAAEISQP